MLRSLKTLLNFTVHAKAEEAGPLQDVCVDKSTWDIRYLILDTGNWLTGRTILLSTQHLEQFDADAQTLAVNLSLADIESGPELKSTRDLTRNFEERLFKHFQWGPYWPAPAAPPTEEAEPSSEPDLYTFEDIKSYEIVHDELTLGWVKDAIYDDSTWQVKSLIFDTGKTLREKIIKLDKDRITAVDHEKKQFLTDMTREEAENCDPFNLMALIQQQLQ